MDLKIATCESYPQLFFAQDLLALVILDDFRLVIIVPTLSMMSIACSAIVSARGRLPQQLLQLFAGVGFVSSPL